MDSGYIAPGENHAQAREDDYDVRRDLTLEEVVGLMDQLLCHEVDILHSHRSTGADTDTDGMAYGSPSFPDPLYVHIH